MKTKTLKQLEKYIDYDTFSKVYRFRYSTNTRKGWVMVCRSKDGLLEAYNYHAGEIIKLMK